MHLKYNLKIANYLSYNFIEFLTLIIKAQKYNTSYNVRF